MKLTAAALLLLFGVSLARAGQGNPPPTITCPSGFNCGSGWCCANGPGADVCCGGEGVCCGTPPAMYCCINGQTCGNHHCVG